MNKVLKSTCTILTVLLLAASCKKDNTPAPAKPSYLALQVGDNKDTLRNPALTQTQLTTTHKGYTVYSSGGNHPFYFLFETDTVHGRSTYNINTTAGGKFTYQFTSAHVLDAPNNGYIIFELGQINNNKVSGTITGELSETTNTGFKTYPIMGTFENLTIQ
jgi:hypothetical protein